jgi:MFS transporter, DHA1 family, multidrug resistance protein
VLFTTVFTGLVYGILYTYFEAFPLVYQEVYKFSPGVLGLAFLAFFVSQMIYVPVWVFQHRYIFEKRIKLHGMGPVEDFLKEALYGCFLLPISLFIFGWPSLLRC